MDDEVLSQPMGWRWVGEVARKRKKKGEKDDNLYKLQVFVKNGSQIKILRL